MVIGCFAGRWRKQVPFPDNPYFTWELRWILGMGPVPGLVANKDSYDKVIGAEAGMGRVPDGNTW
jgi:hypothetical protein